MSFLEALDYDHKMELIDTLSKVTEGKVKNKIIHINAILITYINFS
jgi:hypothetical protein